MIFFLKIEKRMICQRKYHFHFSKSPLFTVITFTFHYQESDCFKISCCSTLWAQFCQLCNFFHFYIYTSEKKVVLKLFAATPCKNNFASFAITFSFHSHSFTFHNIHFHFLFFSVRNQVGSKLVAAPSCEHKFASCAITFKAHQTTLFGESGRIKVCTTKIQNWVCVAYLSRSKFGNKIR